MSVQTWPTSDVRSFDVHIERDGRTWIATSPQAPGWTAASDRRRGAKGIAQLAFEGLAFYLDDPIVSVVARYYWPESVA